MRRLFEACVVLVHETAGQVSGGFGSQSFRDLRWRCVGLKCRVYLGRTGLRFSRSSSSEVSWYPSPGTNYSD